MKSITHLFSIILFVIIFTSCKSREETTKASTQTISYSNIQFDLPKGVQITYTPKEMSAAILSGNEISTIKIFNFGNKPILVQANIDRWKSQFDAVSTIDTETLLNDMVHYVEITGIKKSLETSLMAGIIPTNEGPYYFKAECSTDKSEKTRDAIKKILSSIDYF